MASSQRLNLKWNLHRESIIKEFQNLLCTNSFVDCTLSAEGKYLKAHKMILSACSPYFRDVFSEHFDKHPVLLLKNVFFRDLEGIIEFIYRGEVNINRRELSSFLNTAEFLKIKGLTDDFDDQNDATKNEQSVSLSSSCSLAIEQVALPKNSLSIEASTSLPREINLIEKSSTERKSEVPAKIPVVNEKSDSNPKITNPIPNSDGDVPDSVVINLETMNSTLSSDVPDSVITNPKTTNPTTFNGDISDSVITNPKVTTTTSSDDFPNSVVTNLYVTLRPSCQTYAEDPMLASITDTHPHSEDILYRALSSGRKDGFMAESKNNFVMEFCNRPYYQCVGNKNFNRPLQSFPMPISMEPSTSTEGKTFTNDDLVQTVKKLKVRPLKRNVPKKFVCCYRLCSKEFQYFSVWERHHKKCHDKTAPTECPNEKCKDMYSNWMKSLNQGNQKVSNSDNNINMVVPAVPAVPTVPTELEQQFTC